MYKTAIAGLFSCAIIFAVADSPSVSAEALDIEKITETQQPLTEVLRESAEPKLANEKVQAQPQTVTHTVQANDTLSKIAEKYQTTWKRLFDKNTTIADPNVIAPGQSIVVPTADEILQERALPATVVAVSSTKPADRTAAKTVRASYGNSAGNRYTAGYCTWYVKNMRPDLPNSLGNANTWVSRAAAQGLATGSTPRPGAVGQRGMHVVYVESVNADGTVTISEMNHKGLYVRTVRTLPASYFTYIY